MRRRDRKGGGRGSIFYLNKDYFSLKVIFVPGNGGFDTSEDIWYPYLKGSLIISSLLFKLLILVT